MKSSRTADRTRILDALEQLAQFGVPSPGSAGIFDVGTAAFVQYFEEEILNDLVAAGGATCKIVEGAYGSGKTHLLQLLEDSALKRGFAVVRTDLSQSLNLEDWHLITKHILENIEYCASSGVVRSLPRVLEALVRDGIANTSALATGSLPHSGFARAMSLACSNTLSAEGRLLLNRYLSGERISAAMLRSEDVPHVKHPLSRRNAELLLKTVLVALHRLGLPGTLLLFDEMEKTFTIKRSAPSRRVVAGANLLRRLIDGAANGALVGTAIVFAVLPDFVDQCALAYPALGQRLSRSPRDGPVSWRWPILPLDTIATEQDPRDFLVALVDRHADVLKQCGVDLNGTRPRMMEAGTRTLARHAGSDYRRHLVKSIAQLSLSEMAE